MERFDCFINNQVRVLVIGPNCYKFVEHYRRMGVNIYGHWENNITDNPFVYHGGFKAINFPTDHFDTVICNFKEFDISEVLRILKPINCDGRLVLNLNNNTEFISQRLVNNGFLIECFKDSKSYGTMIIARKPVPERPKILTSAGIGDTYWVLVKMQSFLKQRGLSIPDIYTLGRWDRYNGHMRSFAFLEMFPFVNSAWEYVDFDELDSIPNEFWKAIYEGTDRTIMPGISDYDYLIVYNGVINNGISLEQADPDLECNWFPPMFISADQRRALNRFKAKFGKYIIFHFGFRGTYNYWNIEFPIDDVIAAVNSITDRLELTPLLVGGAWDMNDAGLQRVVDNTRCIDLIGKTSVDELFALIRGSEMIIGYPSGLSMIAPALSVKTLTIWNEFYPEATWWNVVPPSTRNNLYFVLNSKGLTVQQFSDRAVELAG